VIAIVAFTLPCSAAVRVETQSSAAGDELVRAADVSFAKYKGPKWKAVKRRGPPPWAPAHGVRRKRGY
jgi:hypothetical protein